MKNETLPVFGVVGSALKAREYIQDLLQVEDEILELDAQASVDEIKDFRKFLAAYGMKRKVGIINLLNKFSDSNQAILLKIFEELPKGNMCFFSASFLPSFTIQTRSQLHYLALDQTNDLSIKVINFMLQKMKNKEFGLEEKAGLRVFFKAQSLYQDGVISENEREIIFKGLGL